MSTATLNGTIARPGGSSSPLDVSVLAPPWLRHDGDLACGEDPELFFPEDYGMRNRCQINEASEKCLACPVFEACREWAIPITDLDGVWGATTPPQRRRERVKRGKAAAK